MSSEKVVCFFFIIHVTCFFLSFIPLSVRYACISVIIDRVFSFRNNLPLYVWISMATQKPAQLFYVHINALHSLFGAFCCCCFRWWKGKHEKLKKKYLYTNKNKICQHHHRHAMHFLLRHRQSQFSLYFQYILLFISCSNFYTDSCLHWRVKPANSHSYFECLRFHFVFFFQVLTFNYSSCPNILRTRSILYAYIFEEVQIHLNLKKKVIVKRLCGRVFCRPIPIHECVCELSDFVRLDVPLHLSTNRSSHFVVVYR